MNDLKPMKKVSTIETIEIHFGGNGRFKATLEYDDLAYPIAVEMQRQWLDTLAERGRWGVAMSATMEGGADIMNAVAAHKTP